MSDSPLCMSTIWWSSGNQEASMSSFILLHLMMINGSSTASGWSLTICMLLWDKHILSAPYEISFLILSYHVAVCRCCYQVLHGGWHVELKQTLANTISVCDIFSIIRIRDCTLCCTSSNTVAKKFEARHGNYHVCSVPTIPESPADRWVKAEEIFFGGFWGEARLPRTSSERAATHTGLPRNWRPLYTRDADSVTPRHV